MGFSDFASTLPTASKHPWGHLLPFGPCFWYFQDKFFVEVVSESNKKLLLCVVKHLFTLILNIMIFLLSILLYSFIYFMGH